MDGASRLLGVIVLVTGVTVVSMIVNVFVIATLWAWFVTPAFGLAVPQSLGLIAGLSLFVTWFTSHVDNNKGHELDWAKSIAYTVMKPVMYLGIGYAIARAIGTA
jgi:energy-coupling factor transporter transmembrane protein EcfT